jgi:DNA-binding XRE family transcriptional regulator
MSTTMPLEQKILAAARLHAGIRDGVPPTNSQILKAAVFENQRRRALGLPSSLSPDQMMELTAAAAAAPGGWPAGVASLAISAAIESINPSGRPAWLDTPAVQKQKVVEVNEEPAAPVEDVQDAPQADPEPSDCETPLHVRVARAIRARRRDLGMTLREMAAGSGVSIGQVWAIESERAPNPTLASVLAISGALGLSVDQLLDSKPAPVLHP